MYIEDFQSQAIDNTPKIRVIVRKRPLSDKELRNKDYDIVEVRGTQTVVVREQRTKVDLTKYTEEHCFNFDRAFDERTSNEKLYHDTVRPLVECLFQRAKVTCFAYGQTGSGKTFTMMGENKPDRNGNTVPGLYLLASRDIFSLLDQPCFQNLSIHVSFYEIYCGKLHDLLNEKQQLFAREDAKQNVNIVGLAEKKVTNVNSLLQIIDLGNSLRTTSKTSANDGSSRSHAILQIALKDGKKPYGKMSFIDLAGSERGADVNETSKQTRKDGAEINKSLLALKECIRALDQDKKHTPFRGSKLTLVLKDSFTGNCKTVMIGNFSPGILSCEHTLNTLRYADRVKELKKPSGDDAPKSQSDILAKQLMLPRISKNTTKIAAPQSDDDDDEPSNNTSFNASFQSAKPAANSVTKKNNNNGGHQKNSLAAQNQKQQYNNNHNNHNNNNNNNHQNYSQPASQQHKSMPYQSNSLFTKDNRKSSPYDMYTEGLFNMNNNNLTIPPNSLTMPPNSFNMQQNSLTLPPNGLTLQPDLMNNVFNYRNNFQQQQQQQHQQQHHHQQQQQQDNSFQKKGPFFGQAQAQSQSSFTISPNEYLSQLNSMYKTSPFNKENYYSTNNFNSFNKLQELQPQSRQIQQPQNSYKSGQTQTQTASRELGFNKQTSNSSSNTNNAQQAANNDIYVKVEEGSSQPRQTSNAMKLVNLVIMEEQEEMARIHKQYVSGMNDVMKNEYHLLKDIMDPLTDPKVYIDGVEGALTHQMELISVMRASLNKFKDKLKEEEDFNNKFMNIFDSNRMDNFKSEELMLLDDLA